MAQEEHNELRVVVLGGIQSGKTALINTVLNQCAVESKGVVGPVVWPAHCSKRQGDNSGWKLTLVDTRGWWVCFLLKDTAELVKQELLLSVCLCAPGPHAFFLVIEIDVPFTEQNREAIEQHMGLFGEAIWGHTIVVFTRGDSLKGKSIEQHIINQGEALKWVLEKCGNRYHVVDNQSKDPDQVIQLLNKIETLKLANSESYFHIDENTLKAAEESRVATKMKAQARQDDVTQRRQLLEKQGEVRSLAEVRMVLLGWVNSGKTSARNKILNEDELATRKRTIQSDRKLGNVAGRHVSVIDTPGWWKYFSAEYTPEWVKAELKRSLTLAPSPHAFLLVAPADVSFLEEQRQVIQDNMKMFGEMAWRHTMVLFTWGDMLGNRSIEEHIETEGEPLRWLVEKCGNRYHVFDNVNRGDGSQVRELLEKIEEMVASNSVYWVNPVQQKTIPWETEEALERGKIEVVNQLDQEWQRLDKQLEEKIKNMWTKMVDSKLKGNASNDRGIDFNDREPLQEEMEGCSSEIKLPSDCDEGQAVIHTMTKVQHSSEVREQLAREWGRREATIMERVHGILFGLQTSDGALSEVSSEEVESSLQKVRRWFEGTSDYTSESDVEEAKNT